jgi:hypothetical protein
MISDPPKADRDAYCDGRAAGSSAFCAAAEKHLKQPVPDVAAKVEEQDIKDVQDKIAKIIQAVPEGKQRKRLIGKLRRLASAEIDTIERERDTDLRKLDHLQGAKEHISKLIPWISADLTMQRPLESLLHDFQDAIEQERVFDLPQPGTGVFTPGNEIAAWRDLIMSASTYLVNHNWADAFKNARDYVGGEIHLPDDICAFEFRVSDRHVIGFAIESDGILHTQIAVQVRKGWALFPREMYRDLRPLQDLITNQIRAIAIALDAEVATAPVVREPHRRNKERERQGLPPVSYHVVNLARRQRAEPLAQNDNESMRHVRLHFRRGHWRHFETFKTWIKWCLVGNPSLGFVDKHYRL